MLKMFWLLIVLLLSGCQAFVRPVIYQPISFTIFYKRDGTGMVNYTSLVKQIHQLNHAFSGEEARLAKYKRATDAGVRFTLASVRYVQHDEWFDLCTLPSEFKKYRPLYMTDPAIHLNVYICWNANSLGLAWLPYDSWYRDPISESHYSLGISLHHQLLPGNTFKGGLWAKGNILTHEVGHCYGLKHPYEGDCFGNETNSDGIEDTPRMKGNLLQWCSKIKRRDTCPRSPGKDDLQNYMIATSCTSHFTPGQVARMQEVIAQYKPTLAKQAKAPTCVAAIDSTDASPDLQPCLKVWVDREGRVRCLTDPLTDRIWAYACCPKSMGDETCLNKGDPTLF